MTTRLAALVYTVVALALAVFTGSALAGGNGNGNGSTGASPGNSGSAPGQVKQETAPPAPAAAPAAAPAPAPAPAAAPGQDKHAAKAAQHVTKQEAKHAAPAATPTTNDNSHGVKPSSSTAHDTHALASSNKTKQYGNGKTAGQIATQAGYGAASLHGPGNSQPHKVMCGGHEVDVHALKAKGAKCGTTQAPAAQAAAARATKPVEKAEKKDEARAPKAPCPQSVVVIAGSSSSSAAPATSGATGGDNATGVKPSSSTAHDTHELASSSKTKQYGNGTTAGQIATQAGYGGATLHGPGNSQPHKVTCGAHEVDVHALKAKGAACGGVAGASAHVAGSCAQPQVIVPAQTQTQAPTAQAQSQSAQASQPATAAATQSASGTAPATAANAGGVKGVQVTLKPTKAAKAAKPAKAAKSAGGVLGATTTLGKSVATTHLPFTGIQLWIFVAVAAALILAGAAIRRADGV